jgi:hypothetical protein
MEPKKVHLSTKEGWLQGTEVGMGGYRVFFIEFQVYKINGFWRFRVHYGHCRNSDIYVKFGKSTYVKFLKPSCKREKTGNIYNVMNMCPRLIGVI